MSDRRRVVMIGTDIRGGIKAVVQVYAAHGLFARWNVEYVPTHRDGSAFAKLMLAAGALLRVFGLMLTRRVSMVHAHLASGSMSRCGSGAFDFRSALNSGTKANVPGDRSRAMTGLASDVSLEGGV
jgi:hypothetical protein